MFSGSYLVNEMQTSVQSKFDDLAEDFQVLQDTDLIVLSRLLAPLKVFQ